MHFLFLKDREMNIELAKKLSDASGISGFESEVAQIVNNELKNLSLEVSEDNIGSLIFHKKGKENTPKIMLAAHMDEVGFMINHIDENGFCSFAPVGGWWDQVLLGQRVRVISNSGESYIGVIGSKPPHVLPKEERNKIVEIKDMFIDLGIKNKEQLKERNISVGCMVVPYSNATEMIDEDFLLGKAWDNRIGCLVLIEVLKQLEEEKIDNNVYAVFTVQEEVGLKGAKTSAYQVSPDIAFALDTGIAGDMPKMKAEDSSSKLGNGPQYTIMDGGMIINPKLKDLIEKIGEENNIPLQPEILLGGTTDAAAIQLIKEGIPSTCISLATRYLHSHNSIISKTDFDNTVKLIVELIKNINTDEINKITSIN